MASFSFLTLYYLLAVFITAQAFPHHNHHSHDHLHHSVERRDAGNQPICAVIPTLLTGQADLAAKVRDTGLCKRDDIPVDGTSPNPLHVLKRDDDPGDYSCSETRPCSNGACCAKTGWCGYGEASCGTTGTSPNDACWSNCDAHAECGRDSDPPNKSCPLNVCCSAYGFCGMTEEFCQQTNDVTTNCQSNCAQPGSGASGGNVQQRIIGYYEAWNHQKRCIGMQIQDIPVGSLTHIFYSFGYIKPDTYEITTMEDGNDPGIDTFTEFAGLKRNNPALKVIMALGGWSFNDNSTIWQPVFSDMVSTSEKRSRFINQAMVFLTRYGFDGIDIDWEYPGATDRGGNADDGVNLTKLLQEMRVAFDGMGGSRKEISFTAPTSYWYMRHFDIKASVDAADWVNVMAYDLHGVWDADNPIGSHVLAHTNLTEITKALDLLWRNNVTPSKVNMGLGFYGRSFQLADPSCYEPGCVFRGGASPGECTENSGTLSYAEIMDIIDKNNLTPYYDVENAVKWITWGGDQWVSYDDIETFQAKIKFANNLGLGGLLIWAIDLDTLQLDALAAVVYPESLGDKGNMAVIANNWESAGEGQCRVTECGYTGCSAGEVKITDVQCTDENFFTGAYKEQSLCCPFASAPSNCWWRGNEPSCNGQCHAGEVAIMMSKYGAWGKCISGHKFLCCEAEAQMPDCHWTDCGGSCSSDENELTWQYGSCGGGDKRKFCCAKDEEWKNCGWHGKPGNCDDDHCDVGWQVALTTSYEGEGQDCGIWHSDRQRSFCCDPPEGSSPFMPVPLEYLFENPPPADEADTDFTLKVDPTYGGSTSVPFSEDPENAPFGFVVMTSPEELQVSLDKRDGSHWEVFDCFDAVTEGEHTVRMVCTDLSEESNCGKIHLGHGAPGTIIQMPDGCGPGKYAVAKTLTASKNQTLPGHLARRDLTDTVYDLTFDYDFRRVPRDLGDTQMRIDFSNQVGYWDTVVDRAASTKKKRSLADVGNNHKRWLEEEWRDDAHFGALSQEELHKRWFGSDIIDWLSGLLNGVSGGLDIGHTYSEDFVLSIIDQKISCPNYNGKLDVHAETHVDVDVHYGFTLIATLGNPIDLSKSYLYFRNKGEVSAKFVVDAAITAVMDTGDLLMFSADKFGAAFAVPGVVTIGPNFKLFGRLEGQATLGVNFESKITLASWDVHQIYPVANAQYDPAASTSANKDGTQNVMTPEFNYGVSLSGHLTAHVMPTISFGIDFNKAFIPIESCSVNLVADGHITFHAEAQTGSSGTSFCYGIDAGADLYATVEAPAAFNWALPSSPFPIMPIDDVQIYPSGGSPACWTPSKKRDTENATVLAIDGVPATEPSTHLHQYGKRARVYGPLIPSISGLGCPGETDVGDIPDCPLCGSDDEDGLTKRADADICYYDPYITSEERCPIDANAKRDFDLDDEEDIHNSTLHWLSARATKSLSWTDGAGVLWTLPCPTYPSCGVAAKKTIGKWYGFRTATANNACPVKIEKLAKTLTDPTQYITEHVYEAQLLKRFLEFLVTGPMPAGYTPASRSWVSEVMLGLNSARTFKPAGTVWTQNDIWDELAVGLGGDWNTNLLVLADTGMNGRKGVFFNGNVPTSSNQNGNRATRIMHRNTAGVFQYMNMDAIWSIFTETSQHMEDVFDEFDIAYPWATGGIYSAGELGIPTRQAGEPRAGLRDLYCFWIDRTLGQIETVASGWLTAAGTNYKTKYGSSKEGKAWLKNVLSSSGVIKPSALKFPASTIKHASAGQGQQWANSNYEDLWKGANGAAGPF